MRIILFILFLGLFGCDINQPFNYDDTSKKWMEEKSLIKIPDTARFVSSYTANEFGEILKFYVDSISAINFIEKYKLQRVFKPSEIQVIQFSDIESGKEIDNQIGFQEFYYLTWEDSLKLKWNIVLNKKSGELWFEVLYKD